MDPREMIERAPVYVILTCLTVLFHGAAMWLVRGHAERHMRYIEKHSGFLPREIFTVAIVCMMMAAHIVEMAIWAIAIYWIGIIPDWYTAYYYAMETYTTVGYGDVLPPHPWRPLAGWLSATGILMFAWSTAVFTSILTRMRVTAKLTP